MAELTSREIVFWLSLFGLDFGLTMLMPERYRILIGATVTGLSLTGLIWSLGHPVSGYGDYSAVFYFVGAGIGSMLLGGLVREKDLPAEMYDAADRLDSLLHRTDYRVGHSNGQSAEWRKILAHYRRDHKDDIYMLVRVAGVWRNRAIKRMARKPQSIEDIASVSRWLAETANESRRYLPVRLLIYGWTGAALGYLAFVGFHFGVRLFRP